jgi:cell fate regulator YaaT (PSP1 superfamily)
MSEAQSLESSFLAVRHSGALPRPYRWGLGQPQPGQQIIVERPGGGEEVVTVVGPHNGDTDELPHAFAEASEERLDLLSRRQQFEEKAFSFARARARSRNLRLKFVRCSIGGDKKLSLYYASEGSEDLRDLMRDFAVEFGVEVDLVQLAEREAAGKLGGLGPCGRTTCCSTFLKVFPNPSTKMAKDQGIALTPQKLSGRCGKLKCCLAYEADTYREYLEEIALRVGHKVRTPKGYAKIIDVNVMARRVRISTLAKREAANFEADQVERVKGSIPENDEKSGFFYGPQGKPERSARISVETRREPAQSRVERKPSPSSDGEQNKPKRSSRGGRGKGRSQPPSEASSGDTSSANNDSNDGSENKTKRRRRRRSRGPKKND